MKKVITAIGNPILNEKLKNTKEYEVIGNDIQYKEGIIEILKEKENINFLILSSSLFEEEELFLFIDKIKQINLELEIIIVLENENEKTKNILISKGIKNIFYNNKINFNEIKNILEKQKQLSQEELTNEIQKLKEIIYKNKNIKSNIKTENKLKEIIINNKFIKKFIDDNKNINNEKSNNIKNKIISIIGPSGVGKSIFTCSLSVSFENQKILIMDLDILNKSISTIFGIKNKQYDKASESKEKYAQKNNYEELIINVNKNIDLISAEEILCNENNNLNKILNGLKEKYDFILLDTSSECFFEKNKQIIQLSDKSFFLVDANLLELKKAKNLLKIYIENWNIKKEKINIIFNKYNKNSINNNILKNLFSDFEILGEIKLNDNYNLLINKNFSNMNSKIKDEYKKIIKYIKY